MIDKSMIVTIKMLCDSLDESRLGIKALVPTSKKTSYEIFRGEMLRILAYLASIEGDYNDKEIRFINEFLDYDYTSSDLGRLVRNDPDIAKTETEVPIFMKIVVNADNLRLRRNIPHGEATCLTMHSFFAMIGKDFLACDDHVSAKEEAALAKILDNMKAYYEEKDEEYKKSLTADDSGAGSSAGAAGSSNGGNAGGNANGNSAASSSATTGSAQAGAQGSAQGQTDAQAQGEAQAEDFGTLEELLEELHSLVGLEKVKKDVDSLINLVQVQKLREERGLKQVDVSLHLVFSGNPGTGKTTVARLLSKLYCRIGVLSKGHLVEVDRSGLVSGYVGQTALKTKEVVDKSIGGVLFIDEAYALTANRGENDFGMEAVDTLLKGMEDHRDDLAVIVAGYPDLMEQFLSSNPGLRSRFNKFIYFDDYKPDELFGIFKSQCERGGYTADEEALEYAKKFFEDRYNNRDETYANARDVRNFFEKAVVEQANRLAQAKSPTDEELCELKLSDLSCIEL